MRFFTPRYISINGINTKKIDNSDNNSISSVEDDEPKTFTIEESISLSEQDPIMAEFLPKEGCLKKYRYRILLLMFLLVNAGIFLVVWFFVYRKR